MNPLHLRSFTPADRPHLYEICRRTGDLGQDASESCTHPELLGDYYAVPYAMHDPGLCLILEDQIGPCGYILGTADARTFVAWFNRDWLPGLRTKYQEIPRRPAAADGWLMDRLRQDAVAADCAEEFRAELHIDLLPRAQGTGWGRRMFAGWTALAAARGARGVHLGVAKENTRAVGFYERLGMEQLADVGSAWIYGLRIKPA